jgi:GR25 family glycosyltransferase involved in LPS biosynthesis
MTKKLKPSIRIPTYVINLKDRADRLDHIQQQFIDKPEYEVTVFEAIPHLVGAIGLWESTVNIVKLAQQRDLEYVLICEDDLQFTENYSLKNLRRCITKAYTQECDVLLGGIHWFNSALKIAPSLVWIDIFTATHFMIVFRSFYNIVLEASFGPDDSSDLKIAELTENKLVIYPFIVTQKEFGYSDITPQHSEPGYVNRLFNDVSQILKQLNNVRAFYKSIPVIESDSVNLNFSDCTIPTYIINLSERHDRLLHAKRQFERRKEFDVTVIEAIKNIDGVVGLWESLTNVIQLAIKQDHDVIIVCQDDHEFTSNYSRDFLLKNIFEAHKQGADMLSGGCVEFGLAVPLSAQRYWVNQMLSSQFIILYKKFFEPILNFDIKNTDLSHFPISQLTVNKMLLWPFISVQKDFGYSDINPRFHEQKELIHNLSERTLTRLGKINKAYLKYDPS